MDISSYFLLMHSKARIISKKYKKEEKRPLTLPRPKHAGKHYKGFVGHTRTDAGLQDAECKMQSSA